MFILKQQRGFTLLEVLIAMFILSVGLLGIAGLQATSLQYSLDASGRAQVTILAEDIVAKMRLQTNKADNSDIDGIIASYATAVSSPTCVHTDAGVNAELNCWHATVASTLPSGSATITAVGGGVVTVSISWYEQGTRSYTTEAAASAAAAGDVLREGTRTFNLTANL